MKYYLISFILFCYIPSVSVCQEIGNCGWEIYTGIANDYFTFDITVENAGEKMWGVHYGITDSILGEPAYTIEYNPIFSDGSVNWPYGIDIIHSIGGASGGCNRQNDERYVPYAKIKINYKNNTTSVTKSIFIDLRDERFATNPYDICVLYDPETDVFYISTINGDWHNYSPLSTYNCWNEYSPNTQMTNKFQPTDPSNLSVQNYNGHPRLSWSASVEPSSAKYHVFRNNSQITSTPISGTTYTDEDVNCNGGASLNYKIKAISSDGNRWSNNYSNTASIVGEIEVSKPITISHKKTLQQLSSFLPYKPNSIKTYVSNNGILFSDTAYGKEGMFWPGNSNKNVLYTSGLWFVGKDEEANFHTSFSYYVSHYQPGRILQPFNDINYSVDSPTDSRFNVMVITDTTQTTSPDYLKWIQNSSVTGAPLQQNGTPLLYGTSNAYWLMNDLDTVNQRHQLNPVKPLGLQIKNYIFAFNDTGALGNTIFAVFDITNKSTHRYDSLYIGLFSDIDLGFSGDDFDGCDTILSLGYVYNSKDQDGQYAPNPPACGYVILESPTSKTGKAMSSFHKQSNEDLPLRLPGTYEKDFSQKAFDLLRGKMITGKEIIPPNDSTKRISYVSPGDPVTNTGWVASLDYPAGETYILQGSGPATLLQNGTIRFAVAFIVGQGTDRLNSISVLRRYTADVTERWKKLMVTDVKKKNETPGSFELLNAFPNPFNPHTTINYVLPGSGFVTLKIFDALGRETAVLVNQHQESGRFAVDFDASKLSSGMYLYSLTVGANVQTKRMMLVK